MTTPTFRTVDGSLRVAPVGSPIESIGHQVLRAFVEHAEPAAGYAVGDELAIRAPLYQERWTEAQHEERREWLSRERETIALLHPRLSPQLLDLAVESSTGDTERVLAHRWIKGQTLERHIQGVHPTGAPFPLGLKWMRQISDALSTLHEARLIHRNVNPKNILITDTGDAVLIGFSSVQPRQSRPPSVIVGVDDSYSAPEILKELSGTFVTPKADVFSLGAVMSFIFSGLGLTDMVEAPVSVEAWSRLSAHPDGVRLLIAHCMQPFHKNRLVNAGAVRSYLDEDALPTKFSKNFGAIYLAAPWTGSGDESRIGDLSAGPLVSRREPVVFDKNAPLPAFPKAPSPTAPSSSDPSSPHFNPSALLNEDAFASAPVDAPAPIASAASNASPTPHAEDAAEEVKAPEEAVPFWHKEAPPERPAPSRDERSSNAPFFAQRGIPPLTIIFVTLILALAVLFLSNLLRG